MVDISNLDEIQYSKIAAGCRTPSQLSLILKLIDAHEKSENIEINAYKLLTENIDASSYSISDWIISIEFLIVWLAKRNRETTFESAINYLSCCAEASSSGNINISLIDLLDEMLVNYGYES